MTGLVVVVVVQEELVDHLPRCPTGVVPVAKVYTPISLGPPFVMRPAAVVDSVQSPQHQLDLVAHAQRQLRERASEQKAITPQPQLKLIVDLVEEARATRVITMVHQARVALVWLLFATPHPLTWLGRERHLFSGPLTRQHLGFTQLPTHFREKQIRPSQLKLGSIRTQTPESKQYLAVERVSQARQIGFI
jgi:hypothetical protein